MKLYEGESNYKGFTPRVVFENSLNIFNNHE